LKAILEAFDGLDESTTYVLFYLGPDFGLCGPVSTAMTIQELPETD
jgi:hypothetical protein